MNNLFKKLAALGHEPEDDTELKTRKSFLIYLILLLGMGAIVWGSIAIFYGLLLQAVIPFGYVVLSTINLFFYSKTKNFALARDFQISISIILPFVFQGVLGGFLSSGFLMLWGIPPLISALFFEEPKGALKWLILFTVLTLVFAIGDHYLFVTFKPEILSEFSLIFSILNVSFVVMIVFGLVSLFVFRLDKARMSLDTKQKEINSAYHAVSKARNELQKKNEQLEIANEAKSRFLATVSHEIRTPLNGIIGITDILKNSDPTPEQKKLIENLGRSNTILLSLINDVLDLSQIEDEKLLLKPVTFNLEEEMHALIEVMSYNRIKNDDRLKLLIDYDKQLPESVRTDIVRLKQVILNLINNGIKFTEEGYVKFTIALQSVEKQTARIRFEIRDTGIGIDRKDQELLFDKFYRVDSFEKEGNGLGLTITNSLVELMGGKLQVESKLGEGSTFSFSIPVEICKQGEEYQGVRKPEALQSRDINILIAEDNEVNRMVLEKMLKNCGCNNYDVAVNGAEAVEKAKETEFDLILMDINMPEMNGLEAADAILTYSREAGRKLPVIGALTANAFKHEIESYLRQGMSFVLSKPFAQKELKEEINRVKMNKPL